MMVASPGLFDHSLPQGFHYRENFITEATERVLLDAIGHVAFSDFEMRGVVARRRVAFFGQSYDSGNGGAVSGIPVAAARHDCAVGLRRCRCVCDGTHQRVPARLAYRLASRRSAVRHRRRSFAVVGMSDEIPAVPFCSVTSAAVASSIGDTRHRPRAAFGVSHDARVSDCIRTSHPSRRRVALFSDVPYAALMAARQPHWRPCDHV